MTFNSEQIKSLSAKLDGGAVKERTQAGRKLSYVEAWHAIAEANRIFGFDAWNRETVDLKQVHEPYKNDKDNWVVGYSAKVRITVSATVREGCGFGSGIDRDLGRAHESALKEAESDAMKRGLMTFGNPFGLALYDKSQENVEHAGNGAKPPIPAARPPVPPTASAAPPAPAISDWDTVVNDIIGEIAKTKTGAEMDALGDANKRRMEKMPAEFKQRVYAVAKRHREQIALPAMAAG